MPRSRTRAQVRAAQRAAGLIPEQPGWSPGRIGHMLRKIWKRFAEMENRRYRAGGSLTGRERRRAIAAAMNRWGDALSKQRDGGQAG